MQNTSLQDAFSEWTEPDMALFKISCLLGLMGRDEASSSFGQVMGFLNANTEFGTTMFEILERLVKGGILESNAYTQYRWNSSFDWKTPKPLLNHVERE